MTEGEPDTVTGGTQRNRQVVVMPDSFGGTLDAVEAAAAIGAGWHAARPHDTVTLAPQSDGGPGFVDVLATAFGGEVRTQTVTGPLGAPVRASWLLHDAVAYLETAQACGLSRLPGPPDPAGARAATTAGVGDLLSAALLAGCRRIVVGLGGSATSDGGRGAAERLGGLAAARRLLAGVDLVVATDVDNPLLGRDGAAAVFAPQKGADAVVVAALEKRLTGWADELERVCGRAVRDLPGAGAAGGLGAFLLACDGRRESGAHVVATRTHRPAVIAGADLVITGEGRLDAQTRHGKLVAAVAAEATAAGVPVLVLVGQSALTPAEEAEFGDVHTLVHHAGSPAAALAEAGPQLTSLTEALARDRPETWWSGGPGESAAEVGERGGGTLGE
ncbi:MAG: glycerate kinase [Gordonia sp. (in: high G+C Gram-positive bacteria)]|uniref:glycerate kinase family protein n=1 Tax=Gordonia sp. (in: high G+C Gram-positive bacteria) TaxID=84139 RepID=UPI0039E59B99